MTPEREAGLERMAADEIEASDQTIGELLAEIRRLREENDQALGRMAAAHIELQDYKRRTRQAVKCLGHEAHILRHLFGQRGTKGLMTRVRELECVVNGQPLPMRSVQTTYAGEE